MSRTVKFKKTIKYPHLSMLDSELGSKVKTYLEQRAAISKTKEEIKKAFEKTETGKVAMAMTGATGYRSGEPTLPAIFFGEDGIDLFFNGVDATPTSQHLHNEPSTVNMLLNGNIITKEEKRALLKQLGILDFKEVPYPKDFDRVDEAPSDDEIPF